MAEQDSGLLDLDIIITVIVSAVVGSLVTWLLLSWPASGRWLVSVPTRAGRWLRDKWRWLRWRPDMGWGDPVHTERFDDRNKAMVHTLAVSATYESRFPDPAAFRYQQAVLVVHQKPGTVGSPVPFRFPLHQPGEIGWPLPPRGSESADAEPLVITFTKHSYPEDVPDFGRGYSWEIRGVHVELGKVLTRELHPRSRKRATTPPSPPAAASPASPAP